MFTIGGRCAGAESSAVQSSSGDWLQNTIRRPACLCIVALGINVLNCRDEVHRGCRASGRRTPLRGCEPTLKATRQGIADTRGVCASGLLPITVRSRALRRPARVPGYRRGGRTRAVTAAGTPTAVAAVSWAGIGNDFAVLAQNLAGRYGTGVPGARLSARGPLGALQLLHRELGSRLRRSGDQGWAG